MHRRKVRHFFESVKSWYSKSEKEVLSKKESNIQKTVGIVEMAVGFAGIFITKGKFVLQGAYVMADGAIVFSSAQNYEKTTPLLHFANDFVSPVIDIQNTSFKYVSPF